MREDGFPDDLPPDRPGTGFSDPNAKSIYPVNVVEIKLTENIPVMVAIYTADPVSGLASNQQLQAIVPAGTVLRGEMKITV